MSVDFGVAGLGSALGNPQDVAASATDYVSDPERVLRWGYHTYHRAPPTVSPMELAATAANTALKRAAIDASDVEWLVVANSEVPEYHQWDVSSAVGRMIGTGLTPTLLLTQGCASGVTGFQQVAGLFAVRDDLDTVLLVALNQASDDHTNRMRFNTCLTSDGAAAAVFRRGHRHLRWLATEQITDPSCVDFFRLEYGGSAAPFPPEGATNATVDPLALVYEHFRRAPEHLADFKFSVTERVATVVKRACARAGVRQGDLKKVVYINDNQQSFAEVARTLGVGVDRTNADLAAGLGHCGAADQLLCLDIYLDRGELLSGDVVALAGMASGMHWFCTIVEI